MAYEPWSDWISPSARRSTCRTDGDILDLFPKEFFTVVEATKILVLSEQLNRGLRAIAVQFGHVQVIHKEYHTLPHRST